eukprot:1162090-Pelagomonas_calceolata.AAC.5
MMNAVPMPFFLTACPPTSFRASGHSLQRPTLSIQTDTLQTLSTKADTLYTDRHSTDTLCKGRHSLHRQTLSRHSLQRAGARELPATHSSPPALLHHLLSRRCALSAKANEGRLVLVNSLQPEPVLGNTLPGPAAAASSNGNSAGPSNAIGRGQLQTSGLLKAGKGAPVVKTKATLAQLQALLQGNGGGWYSCRCSIKHQCVQACASLFNPSIH